MTNRAHDARHLATLAEVTSHLIAAMRAGTDRLQRTAPASDTPTAQEHLLPHLARAVHHTIQLERDILAPPRPTPTKRDLDRMETRRNRIRAHAERIIKAEAPTQTGDTFPRHILERLDDHDLTGAIDNDPVAHVAIRLCQELGLAKDASNWPPYLQQALQTLTAQHGSGSPPLAQTTPHP